MNDSSLCFYVGFQPPKDHKNAAKALVARLKECKDLETGKRLHSLVIQESPGTEHNRFLATSLITMYSRCGDMRKAQRVFDGMGDCDVVSWTSLILGYATNGEGDIALEIFKNMDCAPNNVTLVAVLKACVGLAGLKQRFLEKGVAVHTLARRLGFDKDSSVASSLLVLYGRCGDVSRAVDVFNAMLHRDVVSWTALIAAYVENGEYKLALEVFSCMDSPPNHVTLVTALKACIGLAGIEKDVCRENGRKVHKQAKKHGLDRHTVVSNALIDMYSKSGDMLEAQRVFDTMPERDVISWTTLMSGYQQNEQPRAALDMFDKLDCKPNHVTFVVVLKACTSMVTGNILDRECSTERNEIPQKGLGLMEIDGHV